ncbi:hypothetical protein BC939DRAFT_476441 [Gamsiella multidivaricata]|uniref:uncharacterized protein n=1 Tax=Gamsiella multidivaricata TaxID=101098 RepID=UPI00222103B8|nr:uncharacterized protein BC939DRAFT_476441 [Gamsiella multidivaricata]KAI7825226.1 hypothetical protein BC939DRAFT_476441 [Gamsiella multidivaricata]
MTTLTPSPAAISNKTRYSISRIPATVVADERDPDPDDEPVKDDDGGDPLLIVEAFILDEVIDKGAKSPDRSHAAVCSNSGDHSTFLAVSISPTVCVLEICARVSIQHAYPAIRTQGFTITATIPSSREQFHLQSPSMDVQDLHGHDPDIEQDHALSMSPKSLDEFRSLDLK